MSQKQSLFLLISFVALMSLLEAFNLDRIRSVTSIDTARSAESIYKAAQLAYAEDKYQDTISYLMKYLVAGEPNSEKRESIYQVIGWCHVKMNYYQQSEVIRIQSVSGVVPTSDQKRISKNWSRIREDRPTLFEPKKNEHNKTGDDNSE